MNKYDNYIFLAICEVTFKNFKNSMWVTYANYCKGMAMSLKTGELSKLDKRHLLVIYDELELLFGMSDAEKAEYIHRYFESGRWGEFEVIIRDTKKFFPFTGV